MPFNYQDKRTKQYNNMRSILDYSMGVIYIVVGIILLFPKKIGLDLAFNIGFRIAFAVLCMIYGLWRLYRGYKKQY